MWGVIGFISKFFAEAVDYTRVPFPLNDCLPLVGEGEKSCLCGNKNFTSASFVVAYLLVQRKASQVSYMASTAVRFSPRNAFYHTGSSF